MRPSTAVGAVNTIKIDAGNAPGIIPMYLDFELSLRRFLEEWNHRGGIRVLVLSTGAAAKGGVRPSENGIAFHLVSRSQKSLEQLIPGIK